MKKAILLLPLVLSLTSCGHGEFGYLEIPYCIKQVYDGGIYDYEEGETVDILFYFRFATDVELSYYSPPTGDKTVGTLLYVIDNEWYDDGNNYVIIKDIPNLSELFQYYYHNFKEENYIYWRTILFKIPTSFFRNDRGMFWVGEYAYYNEKPKLEYVDATTLRGNIKLYYQKLMNNTKIEIWKNKSQY